MKQQTLTGFERYGKATRRARMLRVYFLQLWFNLSDPVAEEALYDMASMRTFAGIDLGQEGAPDETTVCKFRRLREENSTSVQMFYMPGSPR